MSRGVMETKRERGLRPCTPPSQIGSATWLAYRVSRLRNTEKGQPGPVWSETRRPTASAASGLLYLLGHRAVQAKHKRSLKSVRGVSRVAPSSAVRFVRADRDADR